MRMNQYRRPTVIEAATRRLIGDVLIFVAAMAGVAFIIVGDVARMAS